MQQESTSWYKQEWCIVLSLLFLFPLGLFFNVEIQQMAVFS